MTIFSELADDIERGDANRIHQWAERVLDELCTGERSVDAVGHPLGFLCLPVHRDGDEGVCVHLWRPSWRHEPLTTSPTHCHSWELLSWVLAGELRNQTFRLVDEPGAPTHRVFEVHSDADGDEIRATERCVRMVVAADTTHRAGESYRLPAGLFHQTIVPDDADLVATLALGRTVAGVVDLSLGGIHTVSHEVRRKICDRDVSVEAAEAVRHAIRRSPATSPPSPPAR